MSLAQTADALTFDIDNRRLTAEMAAALSTADIRARYPNPGDWEIVCRLAAETQAFPPKEFYEVAGAHPNEPLGAIFDRQFPFEIEKIVAEPGISFDFEEAPPAIDPPVMRVAPTTWREFFHDICNYEALLFAKCGVEADEALIDIEAGTVIIPFKCRREIGQNP